MKLQASLQTPIPLEDGRSERRKHQRHPFVGYSVLLFTVLLHCKCHGVRAGHYSYVHRDPASATGSCQDTPIQSFCRDASFHHRYYVRFHEVHTLGMRVHWIQSALASQAENCHRRHR
eukprot:23843_4